MMDSPMLYDSAAGLARVLLVGAGAYVALVILLRVTGKRTLSKMNAFDFVVTVALGSILATVLLSKDVALAEGVLAFVLLALLQYGVTWLSVRSKWFCSWIKSNPQTLLRDGVFLAGPMREERVTHDEIMAAIRQAGQDDPARVGLVTLETDGSLSVVMASARSGSGS